MFKLLNNSRKRPDTEEAKYQKGKQKCSKKPKVIRKSNVLWENNRN